MRSRTATTYLFISSLATILAWALVSTFGPNLMSTLVSRKFGEPRVVCFGTQGIELSASWAIDLFDRGGDSWPLMYGVLPLPRSIARREDSQPFVHLTSANAVSFAATTRPRTFDQEQALLDCQASDACAVSTVVLAEPHRALVVQIDSGFSAVLLDVPLHVIVKGTARRQPIDVRLRSCIEPVK